MRGLDESGNALPDTATSWVMVRDNVTGLVWEVKTNRDGVKDYTNHHDADNWYTWYDPNPETNGGYPGEIPTEYSCTKYFLDAINGANFAGYSDWRLPTRKELRSIAIYGWRYPAINTDYFPNTTNGQYFSSSIYAAYPHGVWAVNFSYGNVRVDTGQYYSCVRCVRTGQ